MGIIDGQLGKEFKESNLHGRPRFSRDHPSNGDGRQGGQTAPGKALDETARVRFGWWWVLLLLLLL